MVRGGPGTDVFTEFYTGDDRLAAGGGDDLVDGGSDTDTGNGGTGSDSCPDVEQATSGQVQELHRILAEVGSGLRG